MPFWPFGTMIRHRVEPLRGGHRRDRGKAKASRTARRRNRR